MPVYLDFHATTPVDERVLEAMLPYFGERFANPASPHRAGVEVAAEVERARARVAELIGARGREMVFLSGATEANNLALLGLAAGADGSRRKIVTTRIEHSSVQEPLGVLASQGFEIETVPVDRLGQLDLGQLAAAVDERTLVVSVAAANHEIGALAPLAQIAEIAHERGALVHSDGAQAAGKIDIDVAAEGVDLLSISAHKLYGPKGVGALYVKSGVQHRVRPLLVGGGHERGLRSGTVDVPGVVGLGAAARVAVEELPSEASRLAALRDRLRDRLIERVPGLEVNGGPNRLPGNLNVRIPGVDGEAMVAWCPDVAFATGSACSSLVPAPSRVLMALHRDAQHAEESIRLCVGRPTTEQDVDEAAEAIAAAAATLRNSAQSGAIAGEAA